MYLIVVHTVKHNKINLLITIIIIIKKNFLLLKSSREVRIYLAMKMSDNYQNARFSIVLFW